MASTDRQNSVKRPKIDPCRPSKNLRSGEFEPSNTEKEHMQHAWDKLYTERCVVDLSVVHSKKMLMALIVAREMFAQGLLETVLVLTTASGKAASDKHVLAAELDAGMRVISTTYERLVPSLLFTLDGVGIPVPTVHPRPVAPTLSDRHAQKDKSVPSDHFYVSAMVNRASGPSKEQAARSALSDQQQQQKKKTSAMPDFIRNIAPHGIMIICDSIHVLTTPNSLVLDTFNLMIDTLERQCLRDNRNRYYLYGLSHLSITTPDDTQMMARLVRQPRLSPVAIAMQWGAAPGEQLGDNMPTHTVRRMIVALPEEEIKDIDEIMALNSMYSLLGFTNPDAETVNNDRPPPEFPLTANKYRVFMHGPLYNAAMQESSTANQAVLVSVAYLRENSMLVQPAGSNVRSDLGFDTASNSRTDVEFSTVFSLHDMLRVDRISVLVPGQVDKFSFKTPAQNKLFGPTDNMEKTRKRPVVPVLANGTAAYRRPAPDSSTGNKNDQWAGIHRQRETGSASSTCSSQSSRSNSSTYSMDSSVMIAKKAASHSHAKRPDEVETKLRELCQRDRLILSDLLSEHEKQHLHTIDVKARGALALFDKNKTRSSSFVLQCNPVCSWRDMSIAEQVYIDTLIRTRRDRHVLETSLNRRSFNSYAVPSTDRMLTGHDERYVADLTAKLKQHRLLVSLSAPVSTSALVNAALAQTSMRDMTAATGHLPSRHALPTTVNHGRVYSVDDTEAIHARANNQPTGVGARNQVRNTYLNALVYSCRRIEHSKARAWCPDLCRFLAQAALNGVVYKLTVMTYFKSTLDVIEDYVKQRMKTDHLLASVFVHRHDSSVFSMDHEVAVDTICEEKRLTLLLATQATMVHGSEFDYHSGYIPVIMVVFPSCHQGLMQKAVRRHYRVGLPKNNAVVIVPYSKRMVSEMCVSGVIGSQLDAPSCDDRDMCFDSAPFVSFHNTDVLQTIGSSDPGSPFYNTAPLADAFAEQETAYPRRTSAHVKLQQAAESSSAVFLDTTDRSLTKKRPLFDNKDVNAVAPASENELITWARTLKPDQFHGGQIVEPHTTNAYNIMSVVLRELLRRVYEAMFHCMSDTERFVAEVNGNSSRSNDYNCTPAEVFVLLSDWNNMQLPALDQTISRFFSIQSEAYLSHLVDIDDSGTCVEARKLFKTPANFLFFSANPVPGDVECLHVEFSKTCSADVPVFDMIEPAIFTLHDQMFARVKRLLIDPVFLKMCRMIELADSV